MRRSDGEDLVARARRFVRDRPAPRCEDCGSDHAVDDQARGLVCGYCGAVWPLYQVGP